MYEGSVKYGEVPVEDATMKAIMKNHKAAQESGCDHFLSYTRDGMTPSRAFQRFHLFNLLLPRGLFDLPSRISIENLGKIA
jgi:hypothetical protein